MTGPKSPQFKRHSSDGGDPAFDALFVGQFLKTKTCKFWQKGKCTRGDACTYAHGVEDVKTMPNLTKTSLCREYLATGTCTKADCSFAHDRQELRATDKFFKTSMCSWYKAGLCHLAGDCRYAHDESELRERPAMPETLKSVVGKKRLSHRGSDKSHLQEPFEEIKWERAATSPATVGRTFAPDVQLPIALQPFILVPVPVRQGIEASSLMGAVGAYPDPSMVTNSTFSLAELLKSAMPDVYED